MTSILVCLHDFHRGGTERVALMLADEWRKLGADVTILCGDQGGGLREDVAPGIKVMALDPPVPRSATSRMVMGQAVASLKLTPDVIFLPGNFHFFLAPYLRQAMPRAKIALKISNPPVPAGLMGKIAAPFFRRATRAVDGFAAMNAGLARQMQALVPGRTVATLYDPVRMGSLPRAPKSGAGNVIWIGRLEPQKDLALALAVMRLLPDAQFTVIGDGAERGLLEGANVRHVAQVSDVVPYLAQADALLVTSRYEGGPAVAVEALAQGVPVVSTDCSFLLQELLTASEAGRIVPSRDPVILAKALQDILDAPRPPSARLHALTTRFEPQACARAYLDWFRRPMTAELKRSLLLLGLVTVITAWFSELFYFPDEHFQVLEFMAHKLGFTPAAALPWEFTARIRPWTQPLIYYAIARPLLWLGVSDLFTIVFVLRLLTGLFSLAALAAFARAILPTIAGDEEKRAFLRYLPLFGFLPYLFVRTSSETFSAAFFALGLAAAIGPATTARLALAGLLCGLAFECRYQSALMTVGLFGWLAIVARTRVAGLATFVGGGIIALLLGALADRWGYGAWVFPPLDYFNVNILQGVAAKTFGREPAFAYLYLLPATGFFAITLVVMAGMVAMWLRNPRHVVTWASLPFVVLHVAVAHKEARFLFPLAILATSFPVLGFSPLLTRWRRTFARVWEWRQGWAAKTITALSLIFMAYLAVYPFGVRPHMPMARYLYRHFSGTAYSFAAPFPSYPMFRSHPFEARQLKDSAELGALFNKGPVFLMSETPMLPPGIPAGTRATLLYSEYPLAGLGYGESGARFIRGYTDFAAKAKFLKLLPLHWYTLYRLERSATMRS